MKVQHDMKYNSRLEPLIMPEYGRNVQQLVQFAKTIPDKDQRQAAIEEILNMILHLYPQSKNVEDYKDKLWTHIYQIAEFDLDVTPPNGIIPTPEDVFKKPEKVPYPTINTKFRHYGNNVQQLIKKAVALEPGPVRDGFVQVIGAYMKLAYKTWNREHYVSDDMIKEDLAALSNNQLTLEDNSSIDHLSNSAKNSVKRVVPASNYDDRRRNNNMGNSKMNNNRDRDNRDRDRDRDRNSRNRKRK